MAAVAAPPPTACISAGGGIHLGSSHLLGWPRAIPATAVHPLVSAGRRRWGRRASLLGAALRRAPGRPRLVVVAKAVDSTQPPSSASASAVSGKAVVSDDEFSLAKVSFGTIGLAVGCTLLSYGFGAYFNILPGSEWSALMLTYGFPLAIIGMALKYAELKPVPCITYSDAKALRERCATPILKQVRNDVTRYRYGDEQHLDEALKQIFQYGQGGGIPRRNAPLLKLIREEVSEDEKYSLVLVFEAKALQFTDFEQRQAKFSSFFGPGVTAEISEFLRMYLDCVEGRTMFMKFVSFPTHKFNQVDIFIIGFATASLSHMQHKNYPNLAIITTGTRSFLG